MRASWRSLPRYRLGEAGERKASMITRRVSAGRSAHGA
jgi:hypothetical protein